MDENIKTWNKVVYIASTVLIGIIAIMFAKDASGDQKILEAGVYDIWRLFIFLPFMVHGLPARMAHMTRIKLEYITNDMNYTMHSWRNRNIGPANGFPIAMEQQYYVNVTPVLYGGIEQLEANGEQVPLELRVSTFLLRSRLFQLTGIFVIFSMFILPNMLNDYTLYRGLDEQAVKMIALGVSSLLFTAEIAFIDYSLYNVVSQTMSVAARGYKRVILLAISILSTIVLILLPISIVFGTLDIQLPIFQFIFNFDLINWFIVFVPVFNVASALITQSHLTLYQNTLNNFINNQY